MSDALAVWIVDDDDSIRWVLERALQAAGCQVRTFTTGASLLSALAQAAPQVLLTDIRMPGMSGLEILQQVHTQYPKIPIIVMTAHTDLDAAVSAYQGGAFEYLPKPFDIDDAVSLVKRAGQKPTQVAQAEQAQLPELIGHAPAMQEVFRAIGRLSRSSMTVLITGESGTGKELIARALHRHSPRSQAPCIALNTSAFTPDLLESELFGHEKGAFTGADTQRRGRFEQADGGTLFLDEIGDMSLPLQTRLLRVLAEGEFYRVGGSTPIKTDVRVIAATHQNLEERVAAGLFREDLLHRLNVIRIALPPLRARREDIPALLNAYLGVAARELGVAPKTLSKTALDALVHYTWPGNVRQLVNVCRRLTLVAPGRDIHKDEVLAELGSDSTHYQGAHWTLGLTQWAHNAVTETRAPLLDVALPEFERALIRVALAHSAGRRQDAAKLLGWGRNTLTRKLRELGMDDAGPSESDSMDTE
jgi:two-component system, NtrC family, nitrogen regulation response regulator GlnG